MIKTKILTFLILVALAFTVFMLAGCSAYAQAKIPVPPGTKVRIAPKVPLTKAREKALGAQAARIRGKQYQVVTKAATQRTMRWTGIGSTGKAAPGFAPAATTHSFGALFGTTEQVLTGEQIDGAVVYFNADGFGDNHLWTEARVVWERSDGPLDTGNLLQPGTSVGIYTNNVLLQTVILESNSIVIPPGLRGRVQTQVGSRMADIGTMVARGTCRGLDLHDAPGGSNNPLPTGGEIGSQSVVVDGIELVAFQPDAQTVSVGFTKPVGLPVTVQGKPAGATNWTESMAFPAGTNRVNVFVTKSVTTTPMVYRVIQTP